VRGRLGDTRASFEDIVGKPIRRLGGTNYEYATTGPYGFFTITYDGDRAIVVNVGSLRDPDLPNTSYSSADWTIDTANQIARKYLPDDSEFVRQESFLGSPIMVYFSKTLGTVFDQGYYERGKNKGPVGTVAYSFVVNDRGTVSVIIIGLY
jgi:hypothetical protein